MHTVHNFIYIFLHTGMHTFLHNLTNSLSSKTSNTFSFTWSQGEEIKTIKKQKINCSILPPCKNRMGWVEGRHISKRPGLKYKARNITVTPELCPILYIWAMRMGYLRNTTYILGSFWLRSGSRKRLTRLPQDACANGVYVRLLQTPTRLSFSRHDPKNASW